MYGSATPAAPGSAGRATRSPTAAGRCGRCPRRSAPARPRWPARGPAGGWCSAAAAAPADLDRVSSAAGWKVPSTSTLAERARAVPASCPRTRVSPPAAAAAASGRRVRCPGQPRGPRPRDADHHRVVGGLLLGDSTESRCSGRPPSTAVSQVPQVPSVQEESTCTPAASTTSRMDRPGGTVRVSPARASSTSKPARTARASAAGREALDVQRPVGHRRSAPPPRRAVAPGPQQYTSVPGAGRREGGQVEQAGLVLGPDAHPVRRTGPAVGAEGHGGGGAPAVVQRPRRARRRRRGQHGQDRGDPDAARDEEVAGRRPQREVVAGPADPDAAPPSSASWTYADRPGRPARGAPRSASAPGQPVAAQRVLAGQTAPQHQVDVRAGRPGGQRRRRPGRAGRA